MPTITLTIQINVPEGTTVEVKPEITAEPKTATAPTIMFSEQPEYPHWADRDSRLWTEEEDAYAQEIQFTNEEVSDIVGRSAGAVAAYRLKRGYRTKTRNRVVDNTAERAMARWTVSEIDYIMENFEDDGAVLEGMARQLGRTVAAVKRKHGYVLRAREEQN